LAEAFERHYRTMLQTVLGLNKPAALAPDDPSKYNLRSPFGFAHSDIDWQASDPISQLKEQPPPQ
jgi:hypothetical protein